jgi:hypothetical protein
MGEGHCNEDNVWITKSHSPMDTEFSPIFGANKMFLLMRNPLDVIPSHCTMMNLGSHSMVPKEEYYKDMPDYWDYYVRMEVNAMKLFFERNHKNAGHTIPTYYIRYEDLLLDPIRVLTELFKFMLDVPSLEGTVLEAQIAKHGSQKNSTKAVYKLKTQSTDLCRNRHMYTENQIQFIKEELKEFLHFYGYVQDADQPDNPTGFFKYNSEEGPAQLPSGGFREANSKVLSTLGTS